MRIANYRTNPNLYFSSRKKKIRMGDDIVRKTKQEFSALSPSYADDYWLCLRTPQHSNLGRNLNIFTDKLSIPLYECRIRYNFRQEVLKDVLAELKAIKEYGVANCAEFAELVEAALLANNFNNSKLAKVMIQLSLYDKLTGDEIYKYTIPFDHMIVLTSLDDEENSKEEIVLDGWIGKAMSTSEAKREYLSMLTRQAESQIVSDGLAGYDLFLDSTQENHDTATLDDVDYTIKIFFEESKKSYLRKEFEKDPEKIISLLRSNFPNLLLKDN